MSPTYTYLDVLTRELLDLFLGVPGQPVLARLEPRPVGLDKLPEPEDLRRHPPLAQDVRELLHVEAVAPVEAGDGRAVLEGDGRHVGGPPLGLRQVRVDPDLEVLPEAADDDVGICGEKRMSFDMI